jgi:hypothetical protein
MSAPGCDSDAGPRPGPPAANAEVPPLEIDVACPGCRYNLRGLFGDPLRCPECGERYDRATLLAGRETAEQIARREMTARLAVGPRLVAFGLGAAAVFGVLFIAFDDFFHPIRRPALVTAAVVVVAGLGVWAIQTRGLPGRVLAGGRYLAISLAYVLANVLLGAIGVGLLVALFREAGVFFALILIVVSPLIRPLRFIRRYADAQLGALVDAALERDGVLLSSVPPAEEPDKWGAGHW